MSTRKHFAAGDYLTRDPKNSAYPLLIETPFQKNGWKPRITSLQGVTFPGTAIHFEDRYYEVVLIEKQNSRFHYYLNFWEDKFPIRVQFRYTAQQCILDMKTRIRAHQHEMLRVFTLAIAPLAGLLPAHDQIRIENELGISSIRMTFLSALLALIPGGASIIFLLAALLGGKISGQASPSAFLYVLGSYFFFESLARIYNAFKLEEPMGSAAVVIPWQILSAILTSKPEETREIRKVPNDRVQKAKISDYDLEVISHLPKPHWSATTGIQYQGKWYGLVNSEIKTGKEKRYKFYLKEAPEHFCFRTTSIYTEDEPARLWLDERRLRLSTWVRTFAPFWGLLRKSDQERLEDLYDFDSLKFSLITIVSLGLIGLTNAAVSIMNMSIGRPKEIDRVLLPATIYLFVESVVRWNEWRKGHPSGSILGFIVRPLASPLLQ